MGGDKFTVFVGGSGLRVRDVHSAESDCFELFEVQSAGEGIGGLERSEDVGVGALAESQGEGQGEDCDCSDGD